jgi:hypothetical protein
MKKEFLNDLSLKSSCIFLVPVSFGETILFLMIINTKYVLLVNGSYLLRALTKVMDDLNVDTFRIDPWSASIFEKIFDKNTEMFTLGINNKTDKVESIRIPIEHSRRRFSRLNLQVFQKFNPKLVSWIKHFLVSSPYSKELESWVKSHLGGSGSIMALLRTGTGLTKLVTCNFFLQFGWIFEKESKRFKRFSNLKYGLDIGTRAFINTNRFQKWRF